jgi:membrane protease YdiL (CAAX protease family)
MIKAFFVGPNGLRAAWRLLMFFALVAVTSYAFKLPFRAVGFKLSSLDQQGPAFAIISRLIGMAFLLISTFIMSKIEHRPMGVYGLPGRETFGKRFWEGTLWGFSSLSALLVVLRLTGGFYFGSPALELKAALYYAALWGLGFVLVGLFEEYLFRGYAQFTLASGIGFWPAAFLLSFLFAWGHASNAGETRLGVLDVFLGGILLCVMLLRTGNLWFAVGFHAAWDWAESYFYGVADSGLPSTGALLHPAIPGNRPSWLTGGTVGPEGSIFSSILEVLLIGLILWRFRGNQYPQHQSTLVTSA